MRVAVAQPDTCRVAATHDLNLGQSASHLDDKTGKKKMTQTSRGLSQQYQPFLACNIVPWW